MKDDEGDTATAKHGLAARSASEGPAAKPSTAGTAAAKSAALEPDSAEPVRKSSAIGLFAATWVVLRKDLLLEWRSRARVNATVFFALMTLVLFSFAVGPETALLARNAGGYLWLSILLASVLSLGESFRVESENAAMEGLRLMPTDARAIFLGKAAANTLFLFGLGLVLFPVAMALYSADVAGSVGQAILILLLGCAGISAPGTLHAAIANQARARDILLPLLLFPILVPALVGAVKATSLVLGGDPMGQLPSWMMLLVVFNLLYWVLCLALFGRVVEE